MKLVKYPTSLVDPNEAALRDKESYQEELISRSQPAKPDAPTGQSSIENHQAVPKCDKCSKPAVLQVKVPVDRWIFVCQDLLDSLKRDQLIQEQRPLGWFDSGPNK